MKTGKLNWTYEASFFKRGPKMELSWLKLCVQNMVEVNNVKNITWNKSKYILPSFVFLQIWTTMRDLAF